MKPLEKKTPILGTGAPQFGMGLGAEQSVKKLSTGAGGEAAKITLAFLEAESQTCLLFPFEQQSEFAFSVIFKFLLYNTLAMCQVLSKTMENKSD